MATFDRFDICEAHYALEIDYNVGGWLRERPSNQRRKEATHIQLERLGFKEGMGFNGFESLSENGKDIYNELEERYLLGDRGYHDCGCRDCFEIAIGPTASLCHECVDAGCSRDNQECCREPELELEEQDT